MVARKEDIKIPGVLSIIDGGEAELEIIGHFHGIESFNSPDDLDRILGLVEGDGLVTLDHCFYTKRILHLEEFQNQSSL